MSIAKEISPQAKKINLENGLWRVNQLYSASFAYTTMAAIAGKLLHIILIFTSTVVTICTTIY
jgi:hypothetical protein